jgi:hypothetical protein
VRSRLAASAGAIATAAAAIGVILATSSPGSSRGASKSSSSPSGSAVVGRRNLVATDTESGTLSYAGAQTVYNRLSGTITALPSVGRVVKPGQTLYEVDNSPVVLFDGTTPAYRELTPGMSAGPDVKQLNHNLIKLGFADGEIADNDTWQAGTTDAVERWQASLGETQTGSITLGQIVFLPGPQRITAVDAVMGSPGGSSASGSGSSASAVFTPQPEFVSYTTKVTTTSPAAPPAPCPQNKPAHKPMPAGCKPKRRGSSNTQAQLRALEALLKAETAELQKQSRASSGTSTGAGGARGSGAASGSGGGRSAGGSASAGSGSAGSGSAGSGSGGGSGGGVAQAILQTSSTQLVVTVDLDATKQSEAVVGEPVTVELPNGSTVDGKITAVSPVAQSSSGSGSGSGGSGSGSGGSGSGSNGGSASASATIPVTIALRRHEGTAGLDQAAVSVNFEQQIADNVLSVPVTALLASAGGGYNVQTAAAPHKLIPVTVGLFAAGYVQISGPGIYDGLAVTDSQG